MKFPHISSFTIDTCIIEIRIMTAYKNSCINS